MSATRLPPRPVKKGKKPSLIPARPKPFFGHRLTRFFIKYGSYHRQAALQSLGQILRMPFTSSMIAMVIAIALALPTGLFLVLENIKNFNQHWNSPAPIILYLKIPTNAAQALTLSQQLQNRPEIETVKIIPPEQGLTEFQQQLGLGEMLSALKDNPLPTVLIVTPKPAWQNSDAIKVLLNSLQQLPAVDQAQLDLEWVKRLNTILQLGKRLLYALSGVLGLGILFIVGSTIHLATLSKREEIAIFQLVGASNAFIRRPFLYSGMWYGLFGAIIAWLLVGSIVVWLNTPIQTLNTLYGSAFVVENLNAVTGFLLLVLGMTLGWLGSWCALYHYLAPSKKPKQQDFAFD